MKYMMSRVAVDPQYFGSLHFQSKVAWLWPERTNNLLPSSTLIVQLFLQVTACHYNQIQLRGFNRYDES